VLAPFPPVKPCFSKNPTCLRAASHLETIFVFLVFLELVIAARYLHPSRSSCLCRPAVLRFLTIDWIVDLFDPFIPCDKNAFPGPCVFFDFFGGRFASLPPLLRILLRRSVCEKNPRSVSVNPDGFLGCFLFFTVKRYQPCARYTLPLCARAGSSF